MDQYKMKCFFILKLKFRFSLRVFIFLSKKEIVARKMSFRDIVENLNEPIRKRILQQEITQNAYQLLSRWRRSIDRSDV